MAELTGIPRDRIAKWEQGKGVPKLEDSLKIQKLIGEVIPNNSAQNSVLVPYFPDVHASAGLNFLTTNGTQTHSFISVPNIDAEAYINVFGDSMEPKYNGGEIIGIKEVSKDFLIFGYAYVVLMKDGAAYIKYVQPGHDKNHWVLDNENKHYKPNEFHLSKIAKVFIIKGKINKTTL